LDAHLFTDIDALRSMRASAGQRYFEFLRVPNLSAGLYHLDSGAEDPQSVHEQDEVYIVASGRGRFRMGSDDREIGPGSVLFVAALLPHRFHDLVEPLDVLVVFGPAEGSAG
jgi:mannose-6-phosphate isomerase-like protein (cupin superfamily)